MSPSSPLLPLLLLFLLTFFEVFPLFFVKESLVAFKLYGFVKTVGGSCKRFVLCHRAGTKYSVSVFGMFDGGESMPLAGEEKTTLSDAPGPPAYQPTGKAHGVTSTVRWDLCQTFVDNEDMLHSENTLQMPLAVNYAVFHFP